MTLDPMPLSPNASHDDYASHEAILQRFADLIDCFTAALVETEEHISPKQWELFTAVDTTEHIATLTHLGSVLGCSRQNVKKLALAIEKRGYVTLQSGHNNAIHIDITESGYEALERIKRRREALLKQMFESITDEDFAALCRALDAMASPEFCAKNTPAS